MMIDTIMQKIIAHQNREAIKLLTENTLVYYDSSQISSFLQICIQVNNTTMFAHLLTHARYSGDLELRFKQQLTLLHEACIQGHTQAVQQLIASNADINAKSCRGKTSLMVAAERGHIKIVQSLIAAGADVNIQDIDGYTALLSSTQFSFTETVQSLIAAGADVNTKTRYGDTALIIAAQNGHSEILQHLIDAGTNINAEDKCGGTALIYAAESGHTESINVLLAASADIHASEDNALSWAARHGYTKIVQTLLRAGADVNATNKYNATALMYAAKNGHTETAQALLRARADIHLQNKEGETAIKLALSNQSIGVVKMLVAHGALTDFADIRDRQAFILIHHMQSQRMFNATTDINASITAIDSITSKDQYELCAQDIDVIKQIFNAGPITYDALQALPSTAPLTMRLFNIPIPKPITQFYGATFISKLNIMTHAVFARWSYKTQNLYLNIMQFVHAFNLDQAFHLYMLKGRPLHHIFASLYGPEVSMHMLNYITAQKADTLTGNTHVKKKARNIGPSHSVDNCHQSNQDLQI